MKTFTHGPMRVMTSPDIHYMRIDLVGFFSPDELRGALGHPELLALLRGGTGNALLNLTGAARLGTDDLEWLARSFCPAAAAEGLRHLSLVLGRQPFDLLWPAFSPTFAALDAPEVRAFPPEDFLEGWASVAWLPAP